MNPHLCLTHTQLILYPFVRLVWFCLARIYMNLVPLALVRLLPDTALLLYNVTISRPTTGDLPFLNPANTITPYIVYMIPLLSLSVTPLVG